MEKDIKKLLTELYEVDSSLKEKEEDLKKIINTMLKIKPNVSINEEFKNNLKRKLSEKIEEKRLKDNKIYNKRTYFQIFSYIFGSAGILAFSFVFYNNYLIETNNISLPIETEKNGYLKNTQDVSLRITKDNIEEENQEKVNDEILEVKQETQKIETKKENIYNENLNQEKIINNNTQKSSPVTPEKSENISNEVLQEKPQSDMMSDSMVESSGFGGDLYDLRMDKYSGIESVSYSFSGDLNVGLQEKMFSYKKNPLEKTNSGIVNIIKSLNNFGMNISDIKNIGINSLNIEEDKDYGYSIYVDFQNANISFYKNWSKWPANNSSLNKENILSKESLVKISDDFLKSYNISTSKYGKAEVDSKYLTNLEKYKNGELKLEDFYSLTYIIYPILIDGKEVYEESGDKKGIRIEIDLVDKKVVSLNGLEFSEYKSYDDKIETDKENILKIINFRGDNSGNTQKLINPRSILISKYNNVGKQIIVPGIMFEIQGKEGKVIVPLSKEQYNYDKNGNVTGSK